MAHKINISKKGILILSDKDIRLMTDVLENHPIPGIKLIEALERHREAIKNNTLPGCSLIVKIKGDESKEI